MQTPTLTPHTMPTINNRVHTHPRHTPTPTTNTHTGTPTTRPHPHPRPLHTLTHAHPCPHTCARAHTTPTYRLVLPSSSESMKLLDSSSLLSTVDALSGGSPRSRRRSPLGCPLVRTAVGQQRGKPTVGFPRPQAPVDLGAGRVTLGWLGGVPEGAWDPSPETPLAGVSGDRGCSLYPPHGSGVGLAPACG